MWPFTERRRRKRHAVNWDASIRCVFPNLEDSVPATVTEVSLVGARLLLERLQVGPYHLVADNAENGLELTIMLPEEMILIPIGISWFKWEEKEQLFAVGVRFFDLKNNGEAVLKRAIRSL